MRGSSTRENTVEIAVGRRDKPGVFRAGVKTALEGMQQCELAVQVHPEYGAAAARACIERGAVERAVRTLHEWCFRRRALGLVVDDMHGGDARGSGGDAEDRAPHAGRTVEIAVACQHERGKWFGSIRCPGEVIHFLERPLIGNPVDCSPVEAATERGGAIQIALRRLHGRCLGITSFGITSIAVIEVVQHGEIAGGGNTEYGSVRSLARSAPAGGAVQEAVVTDCQPAQGSESIAPVEIVQHAVASCRRDAINHSKPVGAAAGRGAVVSPVGTLHHATQSDPIRAIGFAGGAEGMQCQRVQPCSCTGKARRQHKYRREQCVA